MSSVGATPVLCVDSRVVSDEQRVTAREGLSADVLREASQRRAWVQVQLDSGPAWAALVEVGRGRSPKVVVSVAGVLMEGALADVLALRG